MRGLEKNRMGRGQTRKQTDKRTSRLLERIGQRADSLKILNWTGLVSCVSFCQLAAEVNSQYAETPHWLSSGRQQRNCLCLQVFIRFQNKRYHAAKYWRAEYKIKDSKVSFRIIHMFYANNWLYFVLIFLLWVTIITTMLISSNTLNMYKCHSWAYGQRSFQI